MSENRKGPILVLFTFHLLQPDSGHLSQAVYLEYTIVNLFLVHKTLASYVLTLCVLARLKFWTGGPSSE